MRVLLLCSSVPSDATPDEIDTLVTADAVATVLTARGHCVKQIAFDANPSALDSALTDTLPDVVFNLVESVFGRGDMAGLAPALLEKRRIPFTGASSVAITCCADKPFTKRLLREAGLPTPDWASAPDWGGLVDDRLYVVKSATEDCSLGLDDTSVVRGAGATRARVVEAAACYGGTWFAEAYCSGREFNVSLLETEDGLRVLPIAEVEFSNWQPDRPRLVGYAAKWDTLSSDYAATPRVFGIEAEAPDLGKNLVQLSHLAWHLLGLRGYARVDFRLDAAGKPTILEINPNPCLESEAGFAAAALMEGISYSELVDTILWAALKC